MSEDQLERICNYMNRHDPLKKRIERSEVMAYYLNQRLIDPIGAFGKTVRLIDDKLNHHIDFGSDKYP